MYDCMLKKEKGNLRKTNRNVNPNPNPESNQIWWKKKKSYKIQVMKSRIKFDFSRNFLHYGFITNRGRFLLLSCYGYYCSLALSLIHFLCLCVCVYFTHHHLHISVLNHEMWFIKIKVEKREREKTHQPRWNVHSKCRKTDIISLAW